MLLPELAMSKAEKTQQHRNQLLYMHDSDHLETIINVPLHPRTSLLRIDSKVLGGRPPNLGRLFLINRADGPKI